MQPDGRRLSAWGEDGGGHPNGVRAGWLVGIFEEHRKQMEKTTTMRNKMFKAGDALHAFHGPRQHERLS